MQRRSYGPVAGIAVALLGLSACSTRSPSAENRPAQVVPVQGSDRSLIRLSPDTADRLGIKVQPVRAVPTSVAGSPGSYRVIPESAVFYDDSGNTWTYTRTARLVFQRQPVKIAEIEGDEAVLESGPDPGMEVVTVGADELHGIEDGVGGD